MIDIFEEAKARLTMQDVAQHYGFTPNRAGFIRCPFHTGDRTASLKIYPGGRGFHCFACNRGGTTIDFVAALYDLTPLEAVRRLNDDFRLSLPLDRQQTPAERREAERAAQRRRELAETRQAFEQWRDKMIRQLNACFLLAHTVLKHIERPEDMDTMSDAEVLAIRYEAYFEYLADTLNTGTMAEQMEVFRQRKEVVALCNRILTSLQTKSSVA